MAASCAFRVAITLFAVVLLLAAVSVYSLPWPYDRTFAGVGTCYDPTQHGLCMLVDPVPAMYQDMVPVALSREEYSDSFMCGACIEGRGTGGGTGVNPIGAFQAYVSDCCMDEKCTSGDLNFAKSGDGTWDIQWQFVPCPGNEPHFIWEDSHEWSWKIQTRGTESPVDELFVNHCMAQKTADNFFTMTLTEGVPLIEKQLVETKTILGEHHSAVISL